MLLLQQMLIYQLILVLPERYSLRGNILRLRGITQVTGPMVVENGCFQPITPRG